MHTDSDGGGICRGPDLAGKVAIITGAASGIGKAASVLFARRGASLVLMDIDGKGLDDVASAITSQSCSPCAVRGDVARPEDAARAVGEAAARFGGLDVLFANAGIEINRTALNMSAGEWDRLLAVNLKGPFLGAREAIPQMRRRGGGSIIACSSVNGFRTETEKPAYAASKGGLIMLIRSIASDFAADGIRANAICPGWVDTRITRDFLEVVGNSQYADSLQPAGRIARPEEIAQVAAFLASDASAFMTGAAVVVDGGLLSVLNGHTFGWGTDAAAC